LYIIKFRLGITVGQLEEDIRREPFVRSIFTETIFQSEIAEIDGNVAMLLYIDGASDRGYSANGAGEADTEPAAESWGGVDHGGIDDTAAEAGASDEELPAVCEYAGWIYTEGLAG